MKKLFLLILLPLCSAMAMGQAKQYASYLKYIETYKDMAIEQMLTHGIPASITLAQGLLESGAGTSELATKGNNHFGIKCGGSWTGRTMSHDDDLKGECFRVYDSVRESFEDHSRFLERDRYKSLFSYSKTDYKSWATGLKACGYATSPTYATRLISLIETYNLAQYDHATTFASRQENTFASTAPTVTPTPSQPAQTQNTSVAAIKQPKVASTDHRIFHQNKNFYVVVRKGDTFKSLAKEFDTSERVLAHYNERDKNDRLEEGEVVYLRPKRTKADKAYKKKPHILLAGQSFYDVAQQYGIKLKSLYKKNKLSPDSAPKVGMKLVVY